MNVLKKNANFFIKNQQKIRFYFSVVRPKVIETSLSNESCQRIPIELNFCQKINRTKYNALKIQVHQFSSDCAVPQLHYEKFCAETLDSLCDYFEELVESVNELATADVLNKVSKEYDNDSTLLRLPFKLEFSLSLAGWCAHSELGLQIRDLCYQ